MPRILSGRNAWIDHRVETIRCIVHVRTGSRSASMTGESPLCQTLHLVTYYILFFIQLGSRQVHVAGVTPHPNQAWMMQVARNITMEEWGFPVSRAVPDP